MTSHFLSRKQIMRERDRHVNVGKLISAFKCLKILINIIDIPVHDVK